MTYPFAQSMTLLKRTRAGKDDRGNPVYTEQPITFLGVFSPVASDEVQSNSENTISSNPTVYLIGGGGLPEGTTIQPLDRVQIDDDVFEVNGNPLDWTKSPFGGSLGGYEVHLRRVF